MCLMTTNVFRVLLLFPGQKVREMGYFWFIAHGFG